MKRYILPALALTLLASSCKLDLTPENAITYSNAFSTEAELNTTTSTIHFYLDNCMDAFTPLTKVGLLADETQDDGQLREGNPRSIIQASADWEYVYRMIFEANRLHIVSPTTSISRDIASHDIQTRTGAVHSLQYDSSPTDF